MAASVRLSPLMTASLWLSAGCASTAPAEPSAPEAERGAPANDELSADSPRGTRGVRFVPLRGEPAASQGPQPQRPQLPPEQAEATLREACMDLCRSRVDRNALIRRLAHAGADGSPPSSIVESAQAAHPEPTEAQKQGFMDFASGGPGVILTRGGSIDFNPERVELDGQRGQALFLDPDDEVVACVISDPRLLPTAVYVDCPER